MALPFTPTGLFSCLPRKKSPPIENQQPLETPRADVVSEEERGAKHGVEVNLGQSKLESFIETPPVETRFKHCCGNLDFKMEVDCQDQLRRCYEYKNGSWTQTFGRRCKEELGELCYQKLCNEVCN